MMSSADVDKQVEIDKQIEDLRYWSPEGLLKDFASPEERRAIAATLKWLSLHAVCAWRQKRKDPTRYTTSAGHSTRYTIFADRLKTVAAYLLDKKDLDALETALSGGKP